jgi:hypothetical protein
MKHSRQISFSFSFLSLFLHVDVYFLSALFVNGIRVCSGSLLGWGRRIDDIRVCHEWTQLHRVAAAEGLIAIGYQKVGR